MLIYKQEIIKFQDLEDAMQLLEIKIQRAGDVKGLSQGHSLTWRRSFWVCMADSSSADPRVHRVYFMQPHCEISGEDNADCRLHMLTGVTVLLSAFPGQDQLGNCMGCSVVQKHCWDYSRRWPGNATVAKGQLSEGFTWKSLIQSSF